MSTTRGRTASGGGGVPKNRIPVITVLHYYFLCVPLGYYGIHLSPAMNNWIKLGLFWPLEL